MSKKWKSIRVMIVDEHDMVRRGLAAFLKVKADLELVGEARDGLEALQVCERVQPDVILMDLVMPRMNGVDATRAIRERWPQVQVIALTSFGERELVQEALQAGAISYLLKNVSAEDLSNHIFNEVLLQVFISFWWSNQECVVSSLLSEFFDTLFHTGEPTVMLWGYLGYSGYCIFFHYYFLPLD